jgi:phosphoribosyl 1,2-cyclic phosphate phosphodiesterase
MRLTFLGTGTSAGVPAIACGCRVCTSPDPRDNRLRTGAALEFTDPLGRPRTVLIDCTPDLRQQALRAGLTRCDAVLFTHNHVDHTFGADELRRFNVAQRGPVDIYAEPHTMEHLRRVFKHIFEREHNVNDSFVATLIPHAIAPAGPFELYGLTITPVRLLHGRLPILGFRIDPPPSGEPARDAPAPGSAAEYADPEAAPREPVLPLAYCTDVSAIPPESWRPLRGVRTLVLDALRKRHHPTHFTLDQAISAAERIGAASTYFVHMAHDLKHDETDAELPEGMHLAYDGLVLGG